MCGLFGACGPSLSAKDREAVRFLGILSRTRGADSTGLFTALRHTTEKTSRLKFKTHRDIVESPAFMASKVVKEMLQAEPFIIGGHTRAATHGTVKVSNAHPFSIGHYIGTHNGVIASLHDRVNDKTDTEVLFTNIMKDGVDKGIRSGLTKGDMALVFINKSNSTLNYYRNEGRPLFIGVEKKKKKFFWASQKDFLEFAERQHLVEFSSIYSVAPYLLHQINMKTLALSIQEIKPEVLPPAPMVFSSRSSVPLISRPTTFVPESAPSNLVYSRRMTAISPVKVRPVVDVVARDSALTPIEEAPKEGNVFFRGFNDELWDVKHAASLILSKGSGCDCCGFRPHSLFNTVYWLSEKAWICASCMFDERAQELCYEGTTFYEGCFVDSKGKNKAAKKKGIALADSEIPF